MNAFGEGRKLEAAALLVILPWLQRMTAGRYELYERSEQDFQKAHGDLKIMPVGSARWYTVELKAEQAEKHGNFFLETFSNKNPDRPNPGWMHTSAVDFLWYYFLDDDLLYSIRRPALYRWFFGVGTEPGVEVKYPLRAQGKREQLNLTVGRAVPIADVEREIGFKLHHPFADRRAAA